MKQPHLKGLGHPLDDEAGGQKIRHPHDDEADIAKPLDDKAEIQRLGQPLDTEAKMRELRQPLDNGDLEHLIDYQTDMPNSTTGEPDIHLYIQFSS